MRYQKPSLEITIIMNEDVITTSSTLQDTPTGGSNEGGSYENLFGKNGSSGWQ